MEEMLSLLLGQAARVPGLSGAKYSQGRARGLCFSFFFFSRSKDDLLVSWKTYQE